MPGRESVIPDTAGFHDGKKTLFLTLFVRMLKVGGRCAFIVPDGVLFGSSTAHKAIRKEIIENNRLEGGISMSSGVFKPYAEPFKLWLAQVGRERIEEIIDPELTIDRALETYAQKGYPADWINQRLQTIRARKELTDTWKDHGIQEGKEYAILTDEVTKAQTVRPVITAQNANSLLLGNAVVGMLEGVTKDDE